jgi:hypothetical protein
VIAVFNQECGLVCVHQECRLVSSQLHWIAHVCQSVPVV